MKVLLAEIPAVENRYIEGFVQGVEAMLREMPNPSGNDPMDVQFELSTAENLCRVYLVTGRWVGPFEAIFNN